jgi:hypothetical protein
MLAAVAARGQRRRAEGVAERAECRATSSRLLRLVATDRPDAGVRPRHAPGAAHLPWADDLPATVRHQRRRLLLGLHLRVVGRRPPQSRGGQHHHRPGHGAVHYVRHRAGGQGRQAATPAAVGVRYGPVPGRFGRLLRHDHAPLAASDQRGRLHRRLFARLRAHPLDDGRRAVFAGGQEHGRCRGRLLQLDARVRRHQVLPDAGRRGRIGRRVRLFRRCLLRGRRVRRRAAARDQGQVPRGHPAAAGRTRQGQLASLDNLLMAPRPNDTRLDFGFLQFTVIKLCPHESRSIMPRWR